MKNPTAETIILKMISREYSHKLMLFVKKHPHYKPVWLNHFELNTARTCYYKKVLKKIQKHNL
jgi:hypothetical protein